MGQSTLLQLFFSAQMCVLKHYPLRCTKLRLSAKNLSKQLKFCELETGQIEKTFWRIHCLIFKALDPRHRLTPRPQSQKN